MENKKPAKTLPRATISAVAVVICIYILVAVGNTMLVGAETLIQKKKLLYHSSESKPLEQLRPPYAINLSLKPLLFAKLEAS